MLKFKNKPKFDKLFIDTSYVFDVLFWVDTEWLKASTGKTVYLNHILVIQTKKGQKYNILLHVGNCENADAPEDRPLKYFAHANKLEKEIKDYINKNLDKVLYTEEDRRKQNRLKK